VAVTFTLTDGATAGAFAALGLSEPFLEFHNRRPDTLRVTQRGAGIAFDGAPLFADNATLTLVRNSGAGDLTVFSGVLRESPRRLSDESIQFIAYGPWDQLNRYTYLQNYLLATDPANPASSLAAVYMGRVILAQGADGSRQLLSAALADVVNWAIGSGCPIVLGVVTGFDFYVPWREMRDLKCGDALNHLLHWTPDAVAWFDYATAPPTLNLSRRSLLGIQTYPVAGPGQAALDSAAFAPFAEVRLAPLWRDYAPRCLLFFPRINHSNATPWVTLDTDRSPVGTTGREPDCVVGTIELRGEHDTYLEQAVTTVALPTAALAVNTLVTAAIDAAAGPPPTTYFDTLTAFWLRHCPHLLDAGVTILGFRHTYRAPVGGDTGSAGTSAACNAACVRELTAGSITNWMVADYGIVFEEENCHTEVAYSVVTDPNTGAAETKMEKLSKRIVATNASTQTYTQSVGQTAPEPTPIGLAAQIVAATGVLHYDGHLTLQEREASCALRPGWVVNLSHSLPAWAAMLALCQSVEIDLNRARTVAVVGAPRALGYRGLESLVRANARSRPVTDAGSRTTGKADPSAGPQGLGQRHHAPAAGAGAHILTSIFLALTTVAGSVLAVSDLVAAVGTIYPHSSSLATDRYPKSGDRIVFYHAGQSGFLSGTVTNQDPRAGAGDTLFDFAFTANGIAGTWFLHCVQTGAYTPP
jgi:hypothetical protein